ncbi:hypothetical protein C8J56DRAFT_920817 [Mycena floridula]|nr:hypothetical protein C8J56DRAFT_920817 [Mycena floridula]
MIKTKLPLPPDRNPFQGPDYNPEDEDKALPRSELWGYNLPEDRRYEYDVRRNPALLLHPLPGKVIIPQTKLTILIIQWASCNFGLGKKVYSAEDIDSEAFWNADPPPPDHDDEDSDHLSISSFSSSQGSLPFEAFEGVSVGFYEATWDEEPIEDWVHSRFCTVYQTHGWIHRSFVRVLLFNAFSGSQALPTPSQILAAVHVADRLSRRLPVDIWRYAEQFIIAHALLFWKEKYGAQPWDPSFSALSSAERSMMGIFIDAVKWPSPFGYIQQFLRNPLRVCQDAPDILSLPGISSRDTNSSFNVLPELDPETCVCGECSLLQSQLPTSLSSFRHQYFSITSSRQNCDALAETWEPAISAAEEWLDDLVSRVECHFTLFPDLDRRIGPAVLEIANAMNFIIGSQLSDQQLLRFIVVLSILSDDIPPSIPKAPGPFGLGYIVWLPWTADREDYRVDDDSDHVFFATGGWLYDTLGMDGITLLHQRDKFKIVRHTMMSRKFAAVCMPHFRSDFVSLFPSRHSPTLTIHQHSDSPSVDEEEIEVTIVLSHFQTDAFPLLSVCSQTGFSAPHGAVAALIRVEFLGRIIETVWKPNVAQGLPCEHSALWGQPNRCSPTANKLILRVLPPSEASLRAANTTALKEIAFLRSGDVSVHRQQLLKEAMDELSRRVQPLMETGSPLERTRACIVRCGVRDGPVDAMVVLAASLKKNVYVLHRRECWECALIRMSEHGRTVGISIDTKGPLCDDCRDT